MFKGTAKGINPITDKMKATYMNRVYYSLVLLTNIIYTIVMHDHTLHPFPSLTTVKTTVDFQDFNINRINPTV